MVRGPPLSTRTDTLFPYATLFRSSRGRLREGAESYAKDLGQRYSPVRLMCSHPNGETWASRSGSIWVPLAARVLTTSPSFMVFQNMMMAASRFIPAMRSEEHTSELQSLMRISYAVFCLKKQKKLHYSLSYYLLTTYINNTLYTINM